MERRTFIATVGGGITAGLAGCLNVDGDPTGENEVGMTISKFRPESLTVEPGTTVTFINTSSHTHTVTAFENATPESVGFWSTGEFSSQQEAIEQWRDGGGGGLSPNDEFSITFEEPATYPYFCIPHYRPEAGTGMEGRIIVES
ncbi:plastocyanin/azurin family copper-binding protein [Halovenus rubra]|uniref:Plastocyanin/azurin family copper-binding protein n=2 Tax=Halovenus rubra TaxID=869890 RepID=A0ABD5X5F4_9EURY|nr:plastocyanin/azurin family copper-binding protein [Halovenus rubra]